MWRDAKPPCNLLVVNAVTAYPPHNDNVVTIKFADDLRHAPGRNSIHRVHLLISPAEVGGVAAVADVAGMQGIQSVGDAVGMQGQRISMGATPFEYPVSVIILTAGEEPTFVRAANVNTRPEFGISFEQFKAHANRLCGDDIAHGFRPLRSGEDWRCGMEKAGAISHHRLSISVTTTKGCRRRARASVYCPTPSMGSGNSNAYCVRNLRPPPTRRP
jgi:hypothetical protein